MSTFFPSSMLHSVTSFSGQTSRFTAPGHAAPVEALTPQERAAQLGYDDEEKKALKAQHIDALKALMKGKKLSVRFPDVIPRMNGKAISNLDFQVVRAELSIQSAGKPDAKTLLIAAGHIEDILELDGLEASIFLDQPLGGKKAPGASKEKPGDIAVIEYAMLDPASQHGLTLNAIKDYISGKVGYIVARVNESPGQHPIKPNSSTNGRRL